MVPDPDYKAATVMENSEVCSDVCSGISDNCFHPRCILGYFEVF